MVDNRISKTRVRNHYTYNAWKYVVLIAVAIFGWEMIFNVTAYRPPADKKLDVCWVAAGADTELLAETFEPLLKERIADLEEANFLYIGMGAEDDYASTMQFTTYIAAGQGDLYIMPRDRFVIFAREEADANVLLPLDAYIESGVIDLRGIDVERGTFQGAVRGIPATSLYGLIDYGVIPQSLYLTIPAFAGNPDGAAALIDLLIARCQTDKPDWYDEYLRQVQASQLPQQSGQ